MPTQTLEQAIALMSDVVARAKKQEEPLSGQRTYTGSNYISARKAEIFYDDAQKLMRDIVNIYDAITQNKDAPLRLESEKNTPYTVAHLIEKQKLNALLTSLHDYSKSPIAAKDGISVQDVMFCAGVALTALAMVAAAVLAVLTGSFLIAIIIGTALTIAGLAMMSSGFIQQKTIPQIFSPIGKLMHQHYTFFKSKNKELQAPKDSAPLILPRLANI